MGPKVKIQVTDSVFDCDTCANTIEQVLWRQAGIEGVTTDETNEILEMNYDPTQTDATTIEQIVARWGYTQA